MDPIFLFFIAILIMSVVVHEVSHGYAADILGDPTARLAGRLTLNPSNHLDMVGSFIVPVFMYFTTGYMLGWAKPVPYNPYNLRKGKWGPAIVAVAGPLSNIIIAVFFGLLIRLESEMGLPPGFYYIFSLIVYINILLAVFNMLPIPPLDGSKVLFSVLPYKYQHLEQTLERYSFVLLLFIVFFAWDYVSFFIEILFKIITGANLF